jgi:hypothetical protein
LGFQDAHTWRMCVVHGNGKEALRHFDGISERTHRVKLYHYSLPSVSLQPSRLGWWRHVLLFYDNRGTGKGKRSAISVHGDMIAIQNSTVWPNVKLALEFRSFKEWGLVCRSGKISHMDHARWQSFHGTVFEA